MNPLAIAKLVVSVAAASGVGAVVGNAVKISTPAGINLAKKVAIGIGGVVLSKMAGDMASDYVESKIDDVVSSVKKFMPGTKEDPTEED